MFNILVRAVYQHPNGFFSFGRVLRNHGVQHRAVQWQRGSRSILTRS